MSIRIRETCVFWKKQKRWKMRPFTPTPRFLYLGGNPVFWDVTLRPPKGPQNGKKARPPFLWESLFHRGPNRTFFGNKTRFLRNWEGSVRAQMTLCLLWPSSRGGTRAFFCDVGGVFTILTVFYAKHAIPRWRRAGRSRNKEEAFRPVRLEKKRAMNSWTQTLIGAAEDRLDR